VAINHKEYAAAVALMQPALPCVDVSVSGSDLSSSHPQSDSSCGPGIPNFATIADVSAQPLQSVHVPPPSSQLGPGRDGVGELGDDQGAAAGGFPRLSRGNCSVDGFLQFSYVDGTPQSQTSPGRGEAAPDLLVPTVLACRAAARAAVLQLLARALVPRSWLSAGHAGYRSTWWPQDLGKQEPPCNTSNIL
jgi:hypothetical protein